jgi:manganese/iron transport system ATP-binding protein
MAQLLSQVLRHDVSSPPVQLKNATVQYGDVYALDDVSFDLQSGQLVAVVGPNGAGKTTLFQVIVGVLPLTRGSVHVYGHGPGGHICIAYVPQRSQVDWSFPVTVSEVVMMGRIRRLGLFRWPSRGDWQFVRQALQRVGMDGLSERQIGELSGGQQQRVFLAQALAQEAELVLLDEPLAGLDLPSKEAIFGILEELKRDGVTLLVATHDLNVAAERFDRIMLLNRRLITFGSPGEVMNRKNLIQAFGEYIHTLSENGGEVLLAEPCCGDEEHQRHA